MSEYFHSGEQQSFSFYRTPKALFLNERYHSLSTDAKMLYSLLLDRMELSARNGMYDELGRIYLYFTVIQASELLHYGENKTTRLFRELEKLGLIERIRQGLGKASLIYPKKFADIHPSNQSVLNRQIEGSGTSKTAVLDPSKSRGINTEYNNTEISDTNLSIRYDADEIESRIREQIEYDILCTRYEHEKIDEITALMTEMLSITADTMRIGKYTYPTDLVHSRIGSLQAHHIEYVLDCMTENRSKIRNIKAYMMAALFNAPATAEHHIQADINNEWLPAERGGTCC